MPNIILDTPESKNFLIVLCGPSGAGKTTSAKEFEKLGYTRISQDDTGKDHLRLFREAIERKENVVVDRLNFNKEQRKRYIDQAKKYGYQTSIIVMHENKETCLKRCEERKQHPTITTKEHRESAVNMFFNKYERPSEDEADTLVFIYPDTSKMASCIIVDIDSTMSNTDHRQHFLNNGCKNWRGFFDNMDKDPVNEWCKKLTNSMFNNNIHIVLCSGRPDNYREITKKWLEDNKIHYDYLFMRPRSDSRQDCIIKEIILDYEILSRFSNILFCVDDRKQVIDMWRSRNLTVLDCAGEKGNF